MMKFILPLILTIAQLLNAQSDYIEYQEGDVDIILTAPHGGSIRPDEIPDRIDGCLENGQCVYRKDPNCATTECKATTVTDLNTINLTDIVADRLEELLGGRPHVVISHLARIKLDPNREIEEAAQGDPIAIEAYNTFHDYILQAKASIGRGILFDMHGQSHGQNSSELGYLRSKTELNELDYNIDDSSIRLLGIDNGFDGETLMTGPQSFGALLEDEGFNALPSPRQPFPGQDSYYSGGYITREHGSVNGGLTDAIQIEAPSEVRNEGGFEMRFAFGQAVGNAIANFYQRFYP